MQPDQLPAAPRSVEILHWLKAMRPDQLAELRAFMREILAPRPDISVTDWAEQNVRIPVGATKGQFNALSAPYVREPLDCYGDKSVTDLVLVFGTQCAKTTIMILGMLYRICHDPADCLWVLPNDVLARSFSRSRWRKFIADCKAVQPHLPRRPSGKVDPHLFGLTEQHFDRLVLNFVGSNSAANLASRPASMLQLDEIDKFGEETDFEASALDNAEERVKNEHFPLIVKSSTPTTVRGGIWKEFLLTDQRYYWVPCPRCEQRILLKFKVETETHGDCGIRWWRENDEEAKTDGVWDMEKIRQNAHYRCQACAGEFYQQEKGMILEAGIWRPSNLTAEAGRRGYHLSSLYSQLGPKVTFGAIAVAWCQTFGNISRRHRVINSLFAETWDDERAIDDDPIRREHYGLDILPGTVTRLAKVDVQENHFWAVIRAFEPPSTEKPNGESWQLFADRIETIEEVVAIMAEFKVEPKHVSMDMGKWPNKVAKWIVQHGYRGMWGTDKRSFVHSFENGMRVQMLWSPMEMRDPHLGTPYQSDVNTKAMYVKWANDPIKDILLTLRYSNPSIFHVSSVAHRDYQRHMNAEQPVLIKNARRGNYTRHWKQFSKQNHLHDCECGCLVRALMLGLVPMPDTTHTHQRQQTLDLGVN